MSGVELIQRARPRDNMVRDLIFTTTGSSAILISAVQELQAVGLDFYLRNRGSANVTFSLDGSTALQVDAGDTLVSNGVKFDILTIANASSSTIDVAIGGILINTLRREGLL